MSHVRGSRPVGLRRITPTHHSEERGSDPSQTADLSGEGPQLMLVGWLLESGILLSEDWDARTEEQRQRILRAPDRATACRRLVESGLLTDYQAARVENGRHFGLVLGNYRVLDRLGAGGMGVVFKAENSRLRRLVAVKVMTASSAADERLLPRFVAETRAVAALCHPNIVAAIDAGVVRGEEATQPDLHYFVMEYVPGRDLEDLVGTEGAMAVSRACGLAYQLCGALAEAHRHGLVHRDIKPSNVLVTPRGDAKLLDFGLARTRDHRLTEPGALLGTIGFMAPEQMEDARGVDGRADVYALGCTLFWCLTGREPFPADGDTLQALRQRIGREAPSPRSVRPDLPARLDEAVCRMMATDPADRFQSPQEVLQSLLPFIRPDESPAAPEGRRGCGSSGRPSPKRPPAASCSWTTTPSSATATAARSRPPASCVRTPRAGRRRSSNSAVTRSTSSCST